MSEINNFDSEGTEEIGAPEWRSALADFVRQYHDYTASIFTEGPIEGGLQNCRIKGINAEFDEITIDLSCDLEGTSHYVVANPQHIYFKQDAFGKNVGVDIVALDGTVTHLRLKGEATEKQLQEAS